MTATPARMAFIRTPFRLSVSEDAGVRAIHGTLARESDNPVETFFDSQADAAVMAAERQSLLGEERRRFDVITPGVEQALSLNFDTALIPLLNYSDQERAITRKMLVTSVTIDLARQRAEFGLWG